MQGYIDDLLKREAYETAAQLSPRLLKKNGALWERWVYLFAQIRQLPKLAPYIPTGMFLTGAWSTLGFNPVAFKSEPCEHTGWKGEATSG